MSRHFNVRSKELCYYFSGKRNSRMNTTKAVGTSPNITQWIKRFETGHCVHRVSKNYNRKLLAHKSDEKGYPQ